jgi:hypothetical protein
MAEFFKILGTKVKGRSTTNSLIKEDEHPVSG